MFAISNKNVIFRLVAVIVTTISAFAERLTALRESKGKKRQDVADDIQISRASLEYYEKGKRKPDIEVLLKLADYYNVTCDYLLKGVKTENVSINEVTGLSDKAIETLSRIFKQSKGEYISEKHRTKIQELENTIKNVDEKYVEEQREQYNKMLLEREDCEKNAPDFQVDEDTHDWSFEDWLFYNEYWALDLETTENKKEAEIVLEVLNYIMEQENFSDFMTMMYVYLFADVDTSKGILTGVVSQSLNDDNGYFVIKFDKELLNESYLLRINNYLNEWKDRGRMKVFDLQVYGGGEQ